MVAAFALFSETPQEKWKGASRGLGTFLRYIVHEARSSVTDVMSWRLYVLVIHLLPFIMQSSRSRDFEFKTSVPFRCPEQNKLRSDYHYCSLDVVEMLTVSI